MKISGKMQMQVKYCSKFSEIISDVSLATGIQFFQLEYDIEYWVSLDDNIYSIEDPIIRNSSL